MLNFQGAIFDLDGVIVSTDECHYQAWKYMANQEGIYFDRKINERLRGVSRMQSLDIILEKSEKQYTDAEKQELAARKNQQYVQFVRELRPDAILPGVMEFLESLREQGLLLAIGSSSKNTRIILEQIGLSDYFDAVADGNAISHSKPDPEVFLLAAKLLKLKPENCFVVEDADAGVEAALAGGMKVLAVGSASTNPKATWHAPSLAGTGIDILMQAGKER